MEIRWGNEAPPDPKLIASITKRDCINWYGVWATYPSVAESLDRWDSGDGSKEMWQFMCARAITARTFRRPGID